MKHGVEQELQIVDPESLQLVHGRVEELLAGLTGWGAVNRFADFGRDGFSSQLEYWIGIFRTPSELKGVISAFRRAVIEEAGRLGLAVMGCGVNPLSPTEYPGENFGEHHHIGVNDARHALLVYNMIRLFVPELIALSANSPFYQGEDQKVASYRLARTPHCQCPPELTFRNLLQIQWLSHHSEGPDERYWDVTPFVKMGRGTVEVRLFDVSPSCRDSVAYACILQGIIGSVFSHRNELESAADDEWNRALAENRQAAVERGMRAEFCLSERPVLPLDDGITAPEAIRQMLDFAAANLCGLARDDPQGFDPVGCVRRAFEERIREYSESDRPDAYEYAARMLRKTAEAGD